MENNQDIVIDEEQTEELTSNDKLEALTNLIEQADARLESHETTQELLKELK